jgi:voltage-gated potassium channel
MERSAENLAYWEKRFARPMIAASIVVLVGMCIRVAGAEYLALDVLGNVLADGPWFVFLAQWVVLLRVSPDRWHFLRTHKFLTLIVIVGPLVVAANLIMPVPGLVALSGALRLGPLARWLLRRQSLAYLLGFSGLILLTATVAFWRTEGSGFGDALYWSFTTVTVGSKGPQPTHDETIALSIVLGILRGTFFAVVVGTLVKLVINREHDEVEELLEEAAEQAEIDNAVLAAKLDDMTVAMEARFAALEARLPPKDAS